MKIDIKKVANLANITLTSLEETEFDRQLNDIVGYIEKLNQVDTSNIEPTAQTTGLKNITHDDESTDKSLSVDEALSGGTKTHNGLFVVDKLVETNS